MHLQVRFTARATGRALETSIVQLNRVRDGLVTEFRTYYWDSAAISAVTSRELSEPGWRIDEVLVPTGAHARAYGVRGDGGRDLLGAVTASGRVVVGWGGNVGARR
ncbi:hypothetical protein BWI15_30340 [Kribbella sp. ALI-6-A]|uniref:hypothetical protein n=1 Tax=Kribbella sp. ALI-6-A TaxID=1933817 RepID=UPI00097C341F|nr:hypothetical protein [Kribbella sp. ALI-6-A]ONI67433.1 hypothetical protein BWI15_30340 [Kribbella sp. ALI-6-A]